MLEIRESSCPYAGSGWENSDRWSAQLANQTQGFRIPDRSEAWENNKLYYYTASGPFIVEIKVAPYRFNSVYTWKRMKN